MRKTSITRLSLSIYPAVTTAVMLGFCFCAATLAELPPQDAASEQIQPSADPSPTPFISPYPSQQGAAPSTQAPSSIDSAPAPAPLQGQVQESRTLPPAYQMPYAPYPTPRGVGVPPASMPNFYGQAYQQTPPSQQDPFSQPYQQQQAPRYGAAPPPQESSGPLGTTMKGLVQSLMGLQGMQGMQQGMPGMQQGMPGQFPGQMPQAGEPPSQHPTWLPGYAYTNQFMIAPYHNLDIAGWDKRKIPPHPKWIKLSESVTRFWRGHVSDPCMVLLQPMPEAPGNFTFSSTPQGPRGWLQDTNTSNGMGFPMYRYWFDQPKQQWGW